MLFHFTIRGLLWLMVVVGMGCAIPSFADAQARTFKSGDQVYVRYGNRQGYGVIRGRDSRHYIVQLDGSLSSTYEIPRENVFKYKQEADARILPKAERPPIPDLAPLYQAIGVALGSCFSRTCCHD
jgi:hypothetical protein